MKDGYQDDFQTPAKNQVSNLSTAENTIHSTNKEAFFLRNVTCDEAWIHQFQFEQQRPSGKPVSGSSEEIQAPAVCK